MLNEKELDEAGIPEHHRREARIAFIFAMFFLVIIVGRVVWSIL